MATSFFGSLRRAWRKQAPKCCAPQLPRQFGEGEPIVFACDIVPKTPVLFLKRSTKGLRRRGSLLLLFSLVCVAFPRSDYYTLSDSS
jgi:hypothetical protein